MVDLAGVLACDSNICCSSSKLNIRHHAALNTRPTSLRSPFSGFACKVGTPNVATSNHVTSVSSQVSCSKVKTEAETFPSEYILRKEESSSVCVDPQLFVPPAPSYVGSPLFWVGVGIGFSALVSIVAKKLKNYAAKQAFEMLTGEQNLQTNEFNDASASGVLKHHVPSTSESPSSCGIPQELEAHPWCHNTPSPATLTEQVIDSAPIDQSDTHSPATLMDQVIDNAPKDYSGTVMEPIKPAFSDVSPSDACMESHFESTNSYEAPSPMKEGLVAEVSGNSSSSNHRARAPVDERSKGEDSKLSVEAIERLMEDPAMQKMIYPYLPESMRNPTSFKWMMQNPLYRKELETTIKSLSQGNGLSNSMLNTLKNFSLKSPQVKQQFDRLGLTPQEVMSKIMTNPEVATAFKNPKVLQAIMDCSQTPTNITKYQMDPEVMDAFTKMSKLFPGLGGTS